MGVSYLLDTHVLLWLLGDTGRIPDGVRARLSDTADDLLVSAVSALEVATKVRIGRLSDGGLTEAWDRRVSEIGGTPLAISVEHALLAGRMAWPHRDPFDRLLVAQATIEGCILVTVDAAMTQLPAPRILTW